MHRRVLSVLGTLVFLFCLMSITSWAVSQFSSAENRKLISQHYRLGKKYFEEGKYKVAIREFDAILELDPKRRLAKIYREDAKRKLYEEQKKKSKAEEKDKAKQEENLPLVSKEITEGVAREDRENIAAFEQLSVKSGDLETKEIEEEANVSAEESSDTKEKAASENEIISEEQSVAVEQSGAATLEVTAAGEVMSHDREEARIRAEEEGKVVLESIVEELAEQQEQKIAKHYKKAVSHYRNGELLLARGEINEILQMEPDHRAALRMKRKIEAAVARKERELALQKAQEEKRSRKMQAVEEKLREETGQERRKREAQEEQKVLQRQIDQLFIQGIKLLNASKYEEAVSEWEKILTLLPPLDPLYKKAEALINTARTLQLKQERGRVVAKRKEARQKELLDSYKRWITPGEKITEALPKREIPPEEKELAEKAQKPVSVHFRQKHLREVVRQLSELSEVNIVIDETIFAAGEDIIMIGETSAGMEAQPGLSPAFVPSGGVEGEKYPFVTPDVSVTEGQEEVKMLRPVERGIAGEPSLKEVSAYVDIDLEDVPLVSALELILRKKGLTYRLEKNLIWITSPATLAREAMETRIYHLAAGVGGITEFEEVEEEGAGEEETFLRPEEEGGGNEEVAPLGELEVARAVTIEDVLRQSVPWPEGSALTFDRRSGTLIVTNTPTNLTLVEEIIRPLDVTPSQVSIEARFVELKLEYLYQLGVEFPGFTLSNVLKKGADLEGQISHSFQSGSTENLSFFVGEGLSMRYNKLTGTQFTAILDAIEKNFDADMLSSPRVTMVNQQEATIRVVREYRFPEDGSFEEFYYIWYIEVAGQIFPVQGIFVIPTSFAESEEHGVVLRVTPDIGADGKTVTIDLHPQISELSGWVVYGSGVNVIPVEQVFTRELNTRVVVESGETIVMGGIIDEREKKTISKTPILGDIPLIGRFFKREVETSDRFSMLIFLTVQLLSPTGERIQ